MPALAYKPDDPCPCGSLKRYADCHSPILEAPLMKAIPIAQAIYAKDWAVNAAHYQAQGLYSILAGELVAATTVRRVLDVGCGLGHGLDALAAALGDGNRLIVGVDENPDCLARAAERLQVPGGAVASPRIKLMKLLSKSIGSTPSTAPLKVAGETVLVQADLMTPDPAFEAWLDEVGPLDAITLWFSGVHKARSMTKVSQVIRANSDADLRRALEDEVLALAARRLRPGGILQLVQRGAGEMEVERVKVAQIIAEVVEGSALEVVGVSAHAYEEPAEVGGMTVDSKAFDSTGLQRFALSILLRLKSVV